MHHAPEDVLVKRDVEAHLIPTGDVVTLKEGTMVQITQSLGGSYTVNAQGNLLRISGINADALGKEAIKPDQLAGGESLEDDIWTLLKTCYDPEIPVDIVNLGLIYNLEIIPLGRNQHRVVIVMTLTAPGCGMGPVLTQDVEEKVKAIPGVEEVAVQLVFDPPWSHDMLSEEAKLRLGLL